MEKTIVRMGGNSKMMEFHFTSLAEAVKFQQMALAHYAEDFITTDLQTATENILIEKERRKDDF